MSGTIDTSPIAEANAIPGVFVTINSGGSIANSPARLVLIGQYDETLPNIVAGEPVQVASGQEEVLFGAGSMLAQMITAARRVNALQEIWAVPVAADPTATPATGSVQPVITGTLTRASSYSFEVNGNEYRIKIEPSDTAALIAGKIHALLASAYGVPTTATLSADTVNLTSTWAGLTANDIDLHFPVHVESNGTFVTFSVAPMSGGTANPDISGVLDDLEQSSEEWDYIANPFMDTTNLAALQDYFSEIDGSWSWSQMRYGRTVGAVKTPLAATSALAAGYSYDLPFCIVQIPPKSPTPAFIATAQLGARMAAHLSYAPELTRPLTNLELPDVRAPRRRMDDIQTVDRNSLLFDGVSTVKFRKDRACVIERLVSTYRFDDNGAPDKTFMNIQALAIVQFWARFVRYRFELEHSRKALTRGTNPQGLQSIVSLAELGHTLDHAYTRAFDAGIVEDPETFRSLRRLEIDPDYPDRVNVYAPIDMMGQLYQVYIATEVHINYPGTLASVGQDPFAGL